MRRRQILLALLALGILLFSGCFQEKAGDFQNHKPTLTARNIVTACATCLHVKLTDIHTYLALSLGTCQLSNNWMHVPEWSCQRPRCHYPYTTTWFLWRLHHGEAYILSFPCQWQSQNHSWRAIYVNLWGLSCVRLVGRKSYMMPVIDGFSRYTEGYFLADKQAETTLEALKQNIVLTEPQTGNRVWCVHTDEGTEFCNESWHKFLMERGIVHETTTVYSSASNRVVECAHQTIIECVHVLGAYMLNAYIQVNPN